MNKNDKLEIQDSEESNEKLDEIERSGGVRVKSPEESIHCLSIIGQIE